MAKAKLSDLILDFDLYPRNDISSTHISALFDALQVGTDLPPIIADRKSKRVVDGFHRHRAHQRFGSKKVEVIWREYKNEAQLFIDAVRLNVSHGRPFDTNDRKRAVLRLEEFGLKSSDISDIVRLPKSRIDEFKLALVTGHSGGPVIVKRGLSQHVPKSGTMSKAQEKVNNSWSGAQPTFHVNQLVKLLEAGFRPKTPAFIDGMDRLCELWMIIRRKKSA